LSVLTQLTVPGEARPLKIAPEAIYSSSLLYFSPVFILVRFIMCCKIFVSLNTCDILGVRIFLFSIY